MVTTPNFWQSTAGPTNFNMSKANSITMNKIPAKIFYLVLIVSFFDASPAAERPNIIVIYTDDQGYGDAANLNPGSKFPTPALDRLASEGMTFTDAHSSDSVCTPSRYGLLTGRYAWRTRLKRGVFGAETPCLIE